MTKRRTGLPAIQVGAHRVIVQIVNASGKSQKEIAASARIAEPNLTRIKRGAAMPSLLTIARVARAALNAKVELRIIRRGRPVKTVSPIVIAAGPETRRREDWIHA